MDFIDLEDEIIDVEVMNFLVVIMDDFRVRIMYIILN